MCIHSTSFFSDFRSCVHAELKRALWNDLARVQEYFYHLVPNRCFIPCKKLIIMIKACNIPLDIQIITDMCSVLKKNEQCEIELNDFFIFLDPACVPSCPIPPINVKVVCNYNLLLLFMALTQCFIHYREMFVHIFHLL